ncbi:hypothetical protein [Sphingomonas sp. MMS24-J13]|uniref:hypothetical protein n=1 Tax=Sphingomonas sp. MMS24-J13 TaxID=3238686 RepID=UPI0038511DE5
MLSFLLLIQAATEDPPPPPPPAPVEQLRQIVVDAIRNCTKPTAGEIVVCAPDRGIAEGYRIPKMDKRFAKNLRPSGRGELPAAIAGADLGGTGIGACSKVGAVGSTGCSKIELKAWSTEQKQKRDSDDFFPPR